MITRERYEGGAGMEEFIAAAQANQELWRSVYARAGVPEEVAARARTLPVRHLLVLAEDWCGDASTRCRCWPASPRRCRAGPCASWRGTGTPT